MRAVLALTFLAVAALPATASAETAVETARALVARYHEDPARIDRARDLLEAALTRDSQVETMIVLSRIHYIYGDVRATTDEEKLAAFGRGRELGERAIELAPRDFEAHLWYAINTGSWGDTKGVLRSLSLLPTVRKEIGILLELNPRSPTVHALAGRVLFRVPALLGGDRAKAEEHYRKGLALDPRFTGLRIYLAQLLIATGRIAEARRELRLVLAERAPTNVADWTVRDAPRARELLESIAGKG